MINHMKKRLAELLVLALIASILAVPVMAATVITVDLGTFEVVSGRGDPGGNDNPGNDNPGNDDPGRKDEPGNRNDPGSGKDTKTGSENDNKGVSEERIAQAPEGSDVITEPKTVVPTKTKWRITPSFNVARISSSDKRAIKASKKKDKARSSKGNKWYCGFIKVKKPGTVTITLEGSAGEKEEYLIYAEDPKIKKIGQIILKFRMRLIYMN